MLQGIRRCFCPRENQLKMLLLLLHGLLLWLQPQRLVDPGRKGCRKCAPASCSTTGHCLGASSYSSKDIILLINAWNDHASVLANTLTCSPEERSVLLMTLPHFASVCVTSCCLFHNFAHRPMQIVRH